MRNKRSGNGRSRGGYTLAEALLAVLILMMVSAVLAAGLPFAANALNKVVDTANAQILLSNTMARLRSELATSTEVTIKDGTTLEYTDSYGVRSTIVLQQGSTVSQEDWGIHITKGAYLENELLVSRAAANHNLYVTYTSVSASNGVLTFTGFEVRRTTDGRVLASAPETGKLYKIRILAKMGQG